jgi:hypothetical protein
MRRDMKSNIPAAISAPYAPPRGGGAVLPKHVPIYMPEVYPIPDATEFNPQGSQATAAVETGQINLTPATGVENVPTGIIQLPRNNVGIIRGFSISITNMLTTTDLSWSLLINGAPAGGYGTLKLFPRASSFVGNSFDCFIRVPTGAQISVVYRNTDGGTYVIGASVSGWYWSEASGNRWLQQGY